jgi:hypothetical protein
MSQDAIRALFAMVIAAAMGVGAAAAQNLPSVKIVSLGNMVVGRTFRIGIFLAEAHRRCGLSRSIDPMMRVSNPRGGRIGAKALSSGSPRS